MAEVKRLTDEEKITLARKVISGEISGWDLNTILFADDELEGQNNGSNENTTKN